MTHKSLGAVWLGRDEENIGHTKMSTEMNNRVIDEQCQFYCQDRMYVTIEHATFGVREPLAMTTLPSSGGQNGIDSIVPPLEHRSYHQRMRQNGSSQGTRR